MYLSYSQTHTFLPLLRASGQSKPRPPDASVLLLGVVALRLRLNGLGEDVAALDFVCYGSNKGPFAKFNKCRGLRCKLTVPGCRTSAFGGNCVGYVAVDPTTPNPEYILDPHVLRYIGYPCIEVASPPRSPKLPRINININLHTPAAVGGYAATGQQQQQQADGATDGSALSEEDEFALGLWTVCDCMATQKHPGVDFGGGGVRGTGGVVRICAPHPVCCTHVIGSLNEIKRLWTQTCLTVSSSLHPVCFRVRCGVSHESIEGP